MTLSFSVQLITALSVCISLMSCHGQVNNAGTTDKNSSTDYAPAKMRESSEPMIFPDFRNQIAETVRVMFHDSKGNFWFGTHSGALKLVGDSLVYIDAIKSESGQRVAIRAIDEDIHGNIWFGHTDGISYYDGSKVVNLYESDGLVNKDVWRLTADSKGNIWAGTYKGISKFDGRNFTHVELPPGEIDTTVGVSSPYIIHNILEDRQGRMWFSTNGGIFIKDHNVLKSISEKDGLKSNFTGKVIETRHGEFLICNTKGLHRYKDGAVTDLTSDWFEEPQGTSNITEASNGDIWFNVSRSIYRLKNGNLTEHRISEGDYGPLVYQIYLDRYDRVWFVGWGGAFRFENEKILNITRDGPW
jgi:ligand-binding sensor domain-containing protein